jgi:uncharacterized protein YkwD
MKKIFIFIFVLVAGFVAGFYLKDSAIRLYNDFNKKVENFHKNEFGLLEKELGEKILAPLPLNIGGKDTQVVLVKSKIISETNLQRQENGSLPPLKENTLLDQAAAAKANDMFTKQYFEHVSPSGIDPGKLVSGYGYTYILAGENLILGNFSSEKDAVQNWMDSPGHRANILNNRYTEIGVAIIKGTYNGQTVWIGVQEFGLPLSACPQPDDNLKNQIDADKAKLDSMSIQIDAGKKQIDETSPRSSAYSQMLDDYNQLVAQYNSLAEQTKTNVTNYNNEVNTFNSCVTEN